MRTVHVSVLAVCVILLAAALVPAVALGKRDLGRETLPANDGWASLSPGTIGGAQATAENVFTVRNRRELIAALNNGVYSATVTSPSNTPKIIYVEGTIDANVDDNNQPLTCKDYYRQGYDLQAFLKAFDPAVWGRNEVTGTLNTARLASQQAQQARVRIRVGANTTIVGVDKQSVIRGAWFDLRGTASAPVKNIIIRNLTFEDTYDCFPEWSPADGTLGAWNSLYDSISLRYAENVWVDHNLFRDRETADASQPTYFGVLYQVHDGALDITNVSDLVTVSWNQFVNHDKVMLIGSSDSATTDRGKLRVTLHHNLFDGVGQRAPRVRFGQVHVYNNYYRITNDPGYVYSWGVGIDSAMIVENNAFKIDAAVTPDRLISRLNGTSLRETGTWVSRGTESGLVSVFAAYNATNDPDLTEAVGWTPKLFTDILSGPQVPSAVESGPGPMD